jgi:transposase IS116/IS110/IS902 family protein
MMPRQGSTGGKQKLGPISKQNDRYLRHLLVVGAHAVLRRGQAEPTKLSLAGAAPDAATVQGRSHCACQQDGTRRLGVCWPGEAPIGRHDSRRREKRAPDGRMRLRPCLS